MSTSTSAKQHISTAIYTSTFTLPRPEVHLRPLREQDLVGLEWHGGADLRSFYQKQWEEHQAKDILVMVAEFNNFPVGQMAIHWLGKPSRPHIPDIQSVRVMDAFQGQGIGTQLLKICESIVGAEGHAQIGLAVGLENKAAKRLYERLNYRVTGTPYDDKWSYIDANGQIVRVSELVTDMMKDL